MIRSAIRVKKVTTAELRDRLTTYLRHAAANRVLLVENRRHVAKYLVDKEFLDALVRERELMLAIIEILGDRELTDRLLALSKTIDANLASGRLLKHVEVFGK